MSINIAVGANPPWSEAPLLLAQVSPVLWSLGILVWIVPIAAFAVLLAQRYSLMNRVRLKAGAWYAQASVLRQEVAARLETADPMHPLWTACHRGLAHWKQMASRLSFREGAAPQQGAAQLIQLALTAHSPNAREALSPFRAEAEEETLRGFVPANEARRPVLSPNPIPASPFQVAPSSVARCEVGPSFDSLRGMTLNFTAASAVVSPELHAIFPAAEPYTRQSVLDLTAGLTGVIGCALLSASAGLPILAHSLPDHLLRAGGVIRLRRLYERLHGLAEDLGFGNDETLTVRTSEGMVSFFPYAGICLSVLHENADAPGFWERLTLVARSFATLPA